MKYKTEWDLSRIYKGDPKKEAAKDCASLKKAYLAFADKYRKDKKHLKNPKALAKAIEEMEALSKNPASERPYRYFQFRTCLDSQDNEAQAEVAKLHDFYADLSNQTEFFILEIGKIPKNLQEKFLKAKELAPFRYFLKKVFEEAKHHLSEAEEKIMTLKNAPAHSLWVSGFEKLLSKQTVSFKGREVPIAEAFAEIPNLPTRERRALHSETMKKLEQISDFCESEINAVITDKKINDKLRGYQTPYEATVRGYENDPKTVKDLVASVTENFKIAHRFYRLKAEMIGEKKLGYGDRGAKVGEARVKVPFAQATDKVIELFGKTDPDFGGFVSEMFDKGLVDVFPKKGKHGGAFCAAASSTPTFILLNHVDDFHSLTTLAHEMGHGIHFQYSKSQRPLYEDVSMATAEVASTFFETLVFEQTLASVPPQEKMILLHDKISGDISTIFRQIACFNFENELHLTVRKEGFLPKEKIAALMNKHMQSYLGPVFELNQEDGYFFVNWSHIRNFFYVYSYAFGQLISDALYQMYKKDPRKIKEVKQFLSSGSSDSPENIFRKIGINPDKKFFQSGLRRVEADIAALERLWQESQKQS